MFWVKRLVIAILVLFEGFAFSLPYLGQLLDITQKPRTSDIVVCLGGGTTKRVDKAAILLEEGYVFSKKLLLTGEVPYNEEYVKTHYSHDSEYDIVFQKEYCKTADEIVFMKLYMVDNGYKSAMIVTDPPHSARVALLTRLVRVDGDEGLSFRIISSDVSWWDKQYYRNAHASRSVVVESLALGYSILAYGIAERLGFLDPLQDWAAALYDRGFHGNKKNSGYCY